LLLLDLARLFLDFLRIGVVLSAFLNEFGRDLFTGLA
jgi:hypothetical protein